MTDQPISHGAQVAVMRVLGDEVKAVNAEVRAAAEAHFRELRAAGTKSLHPQLPDGSEVGRITITNPSPVVRWNGPKLVAFVEATAPTEVVERVDPDVLSDPALVMWVLENRPHMVRAEVRDSYRDKLRKELTAEGELVDKSTGELHQVATVERPEASGKFSYRPSDDARDQVMRAWVRGDLSGMGGVFAALGRAGSDKARVEQGAAEETDHG